MEFQVFEMMEMLYGVQTGLLCLAWLYVMCVLMVSLCMLWYVMVLCIAFVCNALVDTCRRADKRRTQSVVLECHNVS